MPETYDCKICHGVNHVKRLQCSLCGTIRPEYSLTGKPARIVLRELESVYIDVVVAYGCVRQDEIRTTKHYMRTVPLDYYAEV